MRLALISDGKTGHQNQLKGLAQALAGLGASHCQWLYPRHAGDICVLKQLTTPVDAVFGAGHRTHGLVLVAGWQMRASTVLLMKPSLPLSWFDWVIAPAHDGLADAGNVISTEGVLNGIESGGPHLASQTLILIGGPCKHYQWQAESLIAQLRTLTRCAADQQLTLLTSRRTPVGFIEVVQHHFPNIACIAPSDAGVDVLPDLLAGAGQVWVTEDSVSMVYEALTSGAKVGVLTLQPVGKHSRVVQSMARLKARAWVTPLQVFEQTGTLAAAPGPLNEARRVAALLYDRLRG
ncbi:MAG: ELM1/GtrOC1 family putative glycosyltransferase [Methylococcales bacterium]|nr:ELM1/GtrOC1 family putative glycosyltransferase [Methylococcales bacterium]